MQPFEAEVGRVLDLVINSLYKERDIFLRELISNSSDACDKRRYESTAAPDLGPKDGAFEISIKADPNEKTLTISDNGIGMNRDELIANLGTIARSGTARFLEAQAEAKGDLNLIGQFGVGFYSAFMVADNVVVTTRKAGDEQGWCWNSDGRSGYTITEAAAENPGTSIVLKLKDDAQEFLSEYKIRDIIRRYSDHIAFPIKLELVNKAGDTKTEAKEPEQINNASALWTRPKSEITDEQYQEFYRHNSHGFDDPFARVHFTAEGTLSYTGLLFVPSKQPFDLFDPKRTHAVKLFVKRVFISDDVEALMPRYLRFVSGVVDSEDLQLNVSRETLQHGAVVAKMRKVLVKRLIDELIKKSKAEITSEEGEDAKPVTTYEDFWSEFGAVLKEGLYEDMENKDKLLELLRVRSTHGAGWSSLADYVSRMKDGQEAIYYISGENTEALRNSPQLEIAQTKGVEVVLLDDPVDEFWIPQCDEFDGKKLVSLTKGNVDLSAIKSEDGKEDETPQTEGLDKLIAKIKLALGEDVKDVRASKRLRDSAVCLVADETGMDMRMERFLKQHNQLDQLGGRILEINGGHELVKRMADMSEKDESAMELDELSKLLLDQARIIEGEPIPDPGAFSKRMSRFLAKAAT